LRSTCTPSARFGKDHAEAIMLRDGSKIRTVSMGPHVYTVSFCFAMSFSCEKILQRRSFYRENGFEMYSKTGLVISILR